MGSVAVCGEVVDGFAVLLVELLDAGVGVGWVFLWGVVFLVGCFCGVFFFWCFCGVFLLGVFVGFDCLVFVGCFCGGLWLVYAGVEVLDELL